MVYAFVWDICFIKVASSRLGYIRLNCVRIALTVNIWDTEYLVVAWVHSEWKKLLSEELILRDWSSYHLPVMGYVKVSQGAAVPLLNVLKVGLCKMTAQ